MSPRRLTIATILTLSACTSAERGPAGDIGGTLVIALPAEPGTMLPLAIGGAQEKEIADQIFDVLAEIGPDLNTYSDTAWTPRLADSWQWAADSLSISFKLNPRARWHDGPAVTSKDVKFSVDLYKDPATGSRFAGQLANVDSISTPDSLTAVAWFARRTPEQFYDFVYSLLLVPEHVLRDADRTKLREHPFARNPVGSGPFKFVRWDAKTRFVVKADSAYHLGRPLLDGVVWMLSPGVDAALEAVLAGEADLFENVTPDAMKRIASQAIVKAMPYSSPNYGYLGFNLRDPKNPERPHSLFADRNLRRALAMGLDRKVLLKNVYDSLGYLGSGPFSRLIPKADTALPMVPFDSAGADRLLDSLGWRDGNGDGVREKGGRPLRFSILVHTTSYARRTYAELIQAQLRPHGVQVDVEALEPAVVGPRFFGGQFDALLMNWITDPSPNSVRDNWHSPPAGQRTANFQSYSNPAADSAIEHAIKEPNSDRSRALYREAYQQIIDDVPSVWLFETRNHMAINGRINAVMNGSTIWWRQLRFWSIPQAGRLPRDGS